MLLLQKISLFNLGVHISPRFSGISNFSCNFLILPNFSGSYDQCFLITDASLSVVASPRFWGIWCSWSTCLVFPNLIQRQTRSWPDSDNTELLPECWYHHHCLWWFFSGKLLLHYYFLYYFSTMQTSHRSRYLLFCLFLLWVIFSKSS